MSLVKLNIARGVTGTLPTSNYVQGGISEADTWRITTNFQGNTNPITANWERDDTNQNGNMGTGMSQSSGIFTFPSTGFYLITFNMCYSSAAVDNDYILNSIVLHDGASSYTDVGFAYSSIKNNSTYQSNTLSKIMDITNTSNQKVCFKTSSQDNNHHVQTSSSQNATYAMFIKLGDT